MKNCIESLLAGGDDVEIIIVDDGSKDKTGEIADAYASRYPDIIKAVHQENGGHGEAVNTGLANATGEYFKVVDSDDWVNEDSLKKMLSAIKYNYSMQTQVDMYVSNYVYEKQGAKHKKVISYRNALPVEEVFEWKDIRHFRLTQYMLMHSITYRRQLLIDCGLKLPAHTFYVDNIFAFNPFPYVKKLYYIDTNFYRYFIGRADQSVNEKVMIGRIDQQLLVNKLMIDYFVENEEVMEKRCKHYMLSYLRIMMTVSSIMLILSETEENFRKKQELWRYVRGKDWKLWFRLRFSTLGIGMNLPGKGGRKVSEFGYKVVNKFIGFN
jgi:glycosyltransferase involved in cell wall biosynthesis